MKVKQIKFKKDQDIPGAGVSRSCSAMAKPVPQFDITLIAKLRSFRVQSLRPDAHRFDVMYIPMENVSSWSFFDEPAEFVPVAEPAPSKVKVKPVDVAAKS